MLLWCYYCAPVDILKKCGYLSKRVQARATLMVNRRGRKGMKEHREVFTGGGS